MKMIDLSRKQREPLNLAPSHRFLGAYYADAKGTGIQHMSIIDKKKDCITSTIGEREKVLYLLDDVNNIDWCVFYAMGSLLSHSFPFCCQCFPPSHSKSSHENLIILLDMLKSAEVC
ncbi:hypothetical protein G5B30_04350 [Sphingobacterium sp. SGG-5]|uniref:hypothetical protein n=1 Tax=Sphingobacterium sp. SGG-5 TaxID=2710881 RepID=UPI0013EDEAD7|nr:hypothetical protein [Sphingobacterium sp. SGG-5]NGM61146.1 hypothetical protein [Sphingobacterium sp. SGG-5]